MSIEALLNKHEIRGESTCTAWGIELLLKLHGRLPIEAYPLQDDKAKGWGFGSEEISAIERKYGLKLGTWHQWHDFGGLCTLIRTNLSLGCGTVFVLPAQLGFDIETEHLGISDHTYTAYQAGSDLVFATRAFSVRVRPTSLLTRNGDDSQERLLRNRDDYEEVQPAGVRGVRSSRLVISGSR